jgi:hypothetical protein
MVGLKSNEVQNSYGQAVDRLHKLSSELYCEVIEIKKIPSERVDIFPKSMESFNADSLYQNSCN